MRRGILAWMSMVVSATLSGTGLAAGSSPMETLDLRIVTDQAQAALQILAVRARGEQIADADWQRLRDSEAYRRLKERQESFGAENFDAGFEAYLSDDPEILARRSALQRTVDDWRDLDLEEVGRSALAYLPAGARLRGTIYPVIKRTTNSFVFDLDVDPAIFLYVDPQIETAKLANTLTHELHHIGSKSACDDSEGFDHLSQDARNAVDWLSGFGEGLAMLAAAGGPEIHPHAASGAAERKIWERDLANFATDLRRLEAFFFEIVRGELSDEERRTKGFTFINTGEVPQGGFYTVGWRMAAMVEKAEGRETVIRAVCDPRVLLRAYNRIGVGRSESGGNQPTLWSEDLLAALSGSAPEPAADAD